VSVAHPSDESSRQDLIALVSALAMAMAPAFYMVSWRPWVRYMTSICILVVLIVIVRSATIWIDTVL
jgi:hypothetical protein